MTENKNEKSDSLWGVLTKEIDSRAIWNILTQEITFGKNSDPQMATMENLDQKADQLLDYAQRVAREKNIPLSEALAQCGVYVGESTVDRKRERMLRSLCADESYARAAMPPDTSEVPTPELVRQPRPSCLTSEEERAILDLIEANTGLSDRYQLQTILNDIQDGSHSLVQKLVLFNLVNTRDIEEAREVSRVQGTSFWKNLICVAQIPANIFADLVASDALMPIANESREQFGEFLLEELELSESEIKAVENYVTSEKVPLHTAVIAKGGIDKKVYLRYLGKFTGLSTRSATTTLVIKPEPLIAMGRELVTAFSAVPYVTAKQTKLLCTRPFGDTILSVFTNKIGARFPQVLVHPDDMPALLDRALEQLDAYHKETSLTRQQTRAGSDRGLVMDAIRDTSAVTLVKKLFDQAIDSGATDIHIEPAKDFVNVRFRIDGILHNVTKLDHGLAQEINSRIKILAEMDITIKRKPLDGHLNLKIDNNQYNLRISTIPTNHGEKMAIRLFDSTKIMTDLNQLGLERDDLLTIKSLTSKPYGMILATGPVGSGKTTTLYSCVNNLNHGGLNVMSIENPIEFDLDGTNQVEVNYDYGMSFADGLRALLRQDPNVILLGEIRDEETASIAVRAALTGLLVLSTLHTNDAPGAITTLLNFNLQGHLIGNALLGVIGQRLLRKICPYCKESHKPTAAQMEKIEPLLVDIPKSKLKFYRGKGCDQCFNSGYLGRIGVYQILTVSPEIRDLVVEGASEREIREKALEQGMSTLASDGIRKVLSGAISVAEFLRLLSF